MYGFIAIRRISQRSGSTEYKTVLVLKFTETNAPNVPMLSSCPYEVSIDSMRVDGRAAL